MGLSASLAHTFHTVEMAARMQLMAQGQVAACVPFATKSRIKMTLYKGEAVLAARREVASKLTHALIAALKRPRRVDKPDWAPMQQLSDAGFKSDPHLGPARLRPVGVHARAARERLALVLRRGRHDQHQGARRDGRGARGTSPWTSP